MREIGISGNYRELEEYFYHRIQNILTKLKRKAVAWEEPFFNSSGGTNGAHGAWIGSRALPKETTIIEIWTGTDYMEEAMQQGYDAILAYGFYLDRQNPVDGLSSWYFSDTWAQMYTVEPEPLLPTTYNRRGKSDRGRALGGEVSMWTEMVDESNIESSIWPRAAAVAERLWSKRQVKDPALAAPRLSHWRCRLVQRYGIRAGPIWSDSCSAVEQKFGTSLHL